MPEPGSNRNAARWQLGGWSLRTKVGVVLLLPAAVALVLGGIRVQEQLAEANRLTSVRDQVAVLRETVDLTNLIAAEMVAAAPLIGTDLGARKAAVDERAANVQRLAEDTGLSTDLKAVLNKGIGQLAAVRAPAADVNPITKIAGYYDIITVLSDLPAGIIASAAATDLEQSARVVESILRLRAVLSIQELVLRFTGGGAAFDPATAQRVTAEEALFSEAARRDIAPADAAALEEATASEASRREALQAAAGGRTAVSAATLLPGITEEQKALSALHSRTIDTLSDTVSARTNDVRADALRDTGLVLGAVLAALALALLVGRSMLSPVRTLRSAALAVAHRKLPETVERVRTGERVDWKAVEPVPVRTGEEIGQLARAFDEMHQQAVRLAGEQAELRRQVSEMFTTLSRRSQSLVELQLETIEDLESDEQDPHRLEGLFKLDHLATRLRRNGENLQVLAGGTPARRGQGPVTIVELLRAATSEVNDYRRVSLGHAPNGSVRGNAAADVVHILAELLENATRFSPPDRKVVLTADRGADGGLLIEVVDGGLGMKPDDLIAANIRLSTADDVGPETTRRMGLYVVSRLAERHGVLVRLRPTFERAKQSGITASVHLPAAMVIAEGTPEIGPPLLSAAVDRGEPAEQTTELQLPARSWFTAASETGSQPTMSPVAGVPMVSIGNGLSSVDDTNGVETLAAINGNSTAQHQQPADAPPVAPLSRWMTPAEEAWQQADTALSPQPTMTTAAGLPMRKPGARVVPLGPDRESVADKRIAFRDPESIRNNLARHYNGVRAARQHGNESDGREGQ